jgi:hypothetical protein
MKILPIQLAKVFSRKDAVMQNGHFPENIATAGLQFAFLAAFHFAFCRCRAKSAKLRRRICVADRN